VTSVRLGLRLALTPAARGRSALLVLAALLATAIVLATAGAGRFELAHASAYQAEMPRLLLAVVAAVALPCAALLSTVARLSAALRDRRLGNLRLIGLTPTQTRLVAAAETGGAAFVGGLLGWLTFFLVRPAMVAYPPAGRRWDGSFAPTRVDQALVLLAAPAVVVLVGLLPTRTTARDPLAVTRRADRTPPGWWRMGPLAVGAALCTTVVAQGHQTSSEDTNRQVALMFAGVGLLAIGLVLVLPVLVRLLTRALAGRPLGAAPRIAVRRLEAQPAGVARIIGALLIGLFLVTGARYVLVAFESTPQYVASAYNVEHEQKVAVDAKHRDAVTQVKRIREIEGVRDVVDLPIVAFGRYGLKAVVATCADLARVGADVSRCRDGEAMWLADYLPTFVRDNFPQLQSKTEMTWVSRSAQHGRPAIPAITTRIDLAVMDPGLVWGSAPVYADAVIPPVMASSLPAATRHTLVVTGPPGRDLPELLNAAGISSFTYSGTDEYDFVATMRAVIWTIAAVVLGVGLLALAIATIDRAVQRRKEVVALQLVGVGPRVIRRAQLLETAVPLTIGIVLAVGLGALSGATFLVLDESIGMPWVQTWRLAGAAVVGGLLVAAVCTIASAPRLRPEELRAE
jgi:hypothetical protein